MTLEEALKEAKDRHIPWFCPVINQDCNERCYCFIAPQAHKYTVNAYTANPITKYSPQGAYCTHRDLQET